MTRFYAEYHIPCGSGDGEWQVVDNKATRGDGVLLLVDQNELLDNDELRGDLAELIARFLNAEKFIPTYTE